MAKLYVQAVPPADLNKNTEWFMYPGVWTTYILILFFSWLMVLSVFGCTPGMAWTAVNLFHFADILVFGISFGLEIESDRGSYLSLLPLEEGNSLCRRPGYVQFFDLVGADGQWPATDTKFNWNQSREGYCGQPIVNVTGAGF
ncbi:hypothetical protein COCNU_09G001650 [Cocos nucifera]|uniref:Uncharacterized protein n=1 Tax=Cocos nucifera TaxID=13894 RepID=A0A8K0IJ64_COCNU|nr:hypothetical protein COCNU_09G001650 [Cocos nucifera]